MKKDLIHVKTTVSGVSGVSKASGATAPHKKRDLESMANFLISKSSKKSAYSTRMNQLRPHFQHNIVHYRTLKENKSNEYASNNTSQQQLKIAKTAGAGMCSDEKVLLNTDRNKYVSVWNVNEDNDNDCNTCSNSNNQNTASSTKKIIHEIDITVLKRVNTIYDNLIQAFSQPPNIIENTSISSSSSTYTTYTTYLQKTICTEYISFLLSPDYLPTLQSILNNNLTNSSQHQIISFFIYQIYLFISFLFASLNILTQDITSLPFITAFNYSKQSFHSLTDITCSSKGTQVIINNNKLIKNILNVLTLSCEIPESVLSSFQYSSNKYTFEDVFNIVKDLTVCEELQIEIIEIKQRKEELHKEIQKEMLMNRITLLICLDEIIVKYVVENEEEYVLERPHASKFINEVSKCYRVGMFTNNTKEYGDYVIERIDTHKKVEVKMYKDVYNENGCLDIDKVKEMGVVCDLKKVVIIESALKKEQYNKIKNDIRKVIYIEEFNGDENDTQLLQLQKNLNDLTKL